MAIRILLVDDHCIVRQGIRSLLDLEKDLKVVGEAGDGERALELLDALRPDVVVLDLKLGTMGGAEVCRQAVARHPEIPIIILTAFSDDEGVLQCIRAGAKGYVLKDVDVFDLAKTIRAVHRGQAVLDPKIAGAVMSGLQETDDPREPSPTLTDRETEIVQLVSKGLTNREIGERLFLSPNTVKYHLHNVMCKLDAKSRAEVVRKALMEGLI